MNERRSGRAKKAISYSKFEDLSDDDFADTTPPPPKKTKAVVEKHKKSSSIHSDPTLDILKTSQLGDSSLRSKKTRKPVSDKVFDRELQEALQLSLIETGGSGSQSEGDEGKGTDCPLPPLLSPIPRHVNNSSLADPPVLVSSDTLLCSTQISDASSLSDRTKHDNHNDNNGMQRTNKNTTNPHQPVSKVAAFSRVMDDSIVELSGGSGEEGKSGRGVKKTRRNLAKKPCIVESDDDDGDFAPAAEDESEDDEDETVSDDDGDSCESDDSDFAPKKKQEKKKLSAKKPVKAPAKPATKGLKSPRTSKTGQLVNITNTEIKPTAKMNQNSSAKMMQDSSAKMMQNSPSPKTPVTVRKSQTCQVAAVSSRPLAITSTPTVKSPPSNCRTSSPAVLTAQWKPPGRASGEANINSLKSPASGLRLGLSRNQRVKPLHCSPKVS